MNQNIMTNKIPYKAPLVKSLATEVYSVVCASQGVSTRKYNFDPDEYDWDV